MNEFERPFCAAADRNKDPILQVLRTVFVHPGLALEIGAGTGQHAVHFATHLAWLTWQPTEREDVLAQTHAGTANSGLANLRPAVALDVGWARWPVASAQGVYSSNTAHILGWPDVVKMFGGIQALLQPGGAFCLYGPFNEEGRFTSQGNVWLDAWARAGNPESGLRDIGALEALGAAVGLRLEVRHALPANNQLLVWRVY